ncbi:MAG TPA: ExeM/NucH family extracellular endonuclease, partial [Ilumatobacteraceae bacterium]|nr:ExeM/NucH family extracellular endonuclease [Ilumatobacteraceae bacterium]
GTTDTPLLTGNLTTQGVVVGDFEGTAAASGFYLQDLTGDGNAATSDGIFVFTGATDLVSVGQVVRVSGFARERFNQTTINGSNSNSAAVPAANIVNCGTAPTPAPVDISLPWANAAAPEAFEGMLVRFPQNLVIAEYFNYARFGEMVLANPLAGENRPFTGTAIDEPGAAANARTAANSLSRITLDDAQSAQNPATLRHPNGAAFSLANSFRGGDTVANAVGVLGFDFSLYRIVPTGPAQYTAVNTRPVAPEDPGGALRFAAMNTLNFFITADYPTGDPLDNKCGGLGNLECRGWDSDQPTEFTRQRDKLVQAIAGLDADVVGLNELENSPGVDALGDPQGVVAGLNAIFGAGTYAYINTGVIGTDAIRVGLIYRPAVVTPVGAFKLLTTAVDPRFLDTKSRPVLAQTFRENSTGELVTVAVNHLKSKGSDCNDVGDPDALDGQGNCNVTRRNAAKALVDWLATDPTGSGDTDFLILGDLNSYAMEDPIDAVVAGADDTPSTTDDYTNLIKQFQGTYAHSYVFDGQAGYLDYALASSSLLSQVTGAADWHINSDEPSILDYDTTFKPPTQDALYEPNAYRSSDHDPVVVGLDLGGDTAKLRPDPVTPSLQSLYVNGSSDADVIYITQVGGLVRVRFGDTAIGDFAVSGRVIVLGQGGNDNVLIDSRLLTTALVYGGEGDDVLSATSNRDNVLVGGDGADTLVGGQGRDLVIGGAGTDSIGGGKGDDVVIGGRTQFDAPVPASQQGLASVLNTWSGGGSYASRVTATAAALGTVVDTQNDSLGGGDGTDWFSVSSGDTTDATKKETATSV